MEDAFTGIDVIVDDFDSILTYTSRDYYIFAIYYSPEDYRGFYVVRAFKVAKKPIPIKYVALCGTLEEARTKIPFGLAKLSRDKNDVASIVEIWI